MSDLLDRSLHGIAVYNPRLLSREELIGYFVARHVEHERIVEALRREAEAQPQHHLIVGARGMGKTTLLNRLRYSIEDDERLATRCFGLVFPEEQYNVVCLADFWLNCVDALADGLESAGRLELLEGLDEEIAGIQAIARSEDRGRRALELLCRLSDRLERRLVLLVDSVDLVLDRIEDEQWALREVLSSEPRIQLVGATSAPLESHYRHDKAFYDFFRVHHLEGLDDEETFTVLRRLAEATEHEGVLRLLDEDPARVRTVRLMAGGNPRTVVMLFGVLAQGTEGDVRTDIERLLDQCTPLYKHRLEVLPTQAQQVLDALAKHWHPATATEIATATHLKVNAVSTQLDRMAKDGTVEKVSLPDTKRQGFQIAERFFNIWCLMRASRRIRRRLVWLVEFLRLMFGAEELTARAQLHLVNREPSDRMRHAELGFAFADLVEHGPLRTALETQSVRTLCIDPGLRSQIGECFDLDGQDKTLSDRIERLLLLSEAREAIMNADIDIPNWTPEHFWSLLGGFPYLKAQEKHGIAMNLHSQTRADITRVMTVMQRHLTYLRGGFVPDEFEILTRAIRDGDIDIQAPTREDLEAAAVAMDEPALIPCALTLASIWGTPVDREWLTSETAHSQSLAPRVLGAECALQTGTPVDAFMAPLSTILEISTWGALGLTILGNILQDHFKAYDLAKHYYHRALASGHDYFAPWYNLGILHFRVNEYDAAEYAFRNSVALESDHTESWSYLAEILYKKNIDLLDAERAARAATGPTKKSRPYHTLLLATILAARGKWSEAERHMRECLREIENNPSSSWWAMILRFFAEAARQGLTTEARTFLSTIGTTGNWEPLDRALEIIEHGDTTVLARIAPEMREAVRLVLTKLWPHPFEDGAGWVWSPR